MYLTSVVLEIRLPPQKRLSKKAPLKWKKSSVRTLKNYEMKKKKKKAFSKLKYFPFKPKLASSIDSSNINWYTPERSALYLG